MIALSTIEVTPAKAKQFQSKGINSVEELAVFFPRKYQDFRARKNIRDLREGDICRVSGVITKVYDRDRVSIELDDGTGLMQLTWFGGCYFSAKLECGSLWTFCGKVGFFRGQPNMVQPVLCAMGEDKLSIISATYPQIKGMSDKYLRGKIDASLGVMTSASVWTEQDAVARSFGLMDRIPAWREMHQPTDGHAWAKAHKRVVFDEIYGFYETMYRQRQNKLFARGKPMPKHEARDKFIASLPFELTKDQQAAVDAVYAGTAGEKAMNTLITGDVGCGKTAVALIAAIQAWENGYQTIVMAPTLVLARQHYEEMSKMAAGTGATLALLTSDVKAKERKAILAGIGDGSIDILIGTHSVLSPDLEFNNLGLTIVDEEHRFGTEQKGWLEAFDKAGTHHLSMTATPIPRSYASSIYGDNLDLITIETMPAGRKPVITQVINGREAAYQKLREEVDKGHQAYVVCPFIEDSEDEKLKNVQSVRKIEQEMKTFYRRGGADIKVGCISGDMKQKDILEAIDKFAANEVQLLVSTTIVEVGVNVPNATAIAIMNADRFGLAPLHQLRGRVGRKGDQGYCYLVSEKPNEKLAAMTMYTSGFKIAEMDMKLRGPGDILGTEQTGDSKIIETILKHPNMAKCIRAYFERKG